jgi:hypothetical protein
MTDHIQLFTDTENPESWMKHANGLSQLVRIRGPDRYNNELDIMLLKAARGLIVSFNHGLFAFNLPEKHYEISRNLEFTLIIQIGDALNVLR